MTDETLTLDIDGWEGPIDLLLALARTQKVDLQRDFDPGAGRAISRFHRAGARTLKLEVAADYLVMAAWLAYLKSALLLPREPEQDPDPDELALRLQLRLERLAAMRDAGARLMARDRLGRDVFVRGAPEGLRTVRKALWQAEIYDLIAAYGRVRRGTARSCTSSTTAQVMTLEDGDRAGLGDARRRRSTGRRSSAFLPAGATGRFRKSALASSFLAVLELARQGRVELQAGSRRSRRSICRAAGA